MIWENHGERGKWDGEVEESGGHGIRDDVEKGDWVWCEVRDDGKEIMVKCVKVWVMGREWKARFTIHSLSRRGGSHLYPDRDVGQPTVGMEGNRIAISILLMSST